MASIDIDAATPTFSTKSAMSGSSQASCTALVDDDPNGAQSDSAAAPVRPGDHFEIVTVWIAKIDAASAIVVVDLAGPAAPWISPVVEAAILDATEDGVEVSFAD